MHVHKQLCADALPRDALRRSCGCMCMGMSCSWTARYQSCCCMQGYDVLDDAYDVKTAAVTLIQTVCEKHRSHLERFMGQVRHLQAAPGCPFYVNWGNCLHQDLNMPRSHDLTPPRMQPPQVERLWAFCRGFLMLTA